MILLKANAYINEKILDSDGYPLSKLFPEFCTDRSGKCFFPDFKLEESDVYCSAIVFFTQQKFLKIDIKTVVYSLYYYKYCQ